LALRPVALGQWLSEYGYVIEGQMKIEYENAKIIYGPGDGIFIPDGPDHRHRGKALTEKVLVFFIEKV